MHSFALASHLPAKLAIVFAVNWFGIPAADPQGSGLDPGWGNWKWQAPACSLTDDPASCAPFGASGKLERVIASRRRPLAGIYSSSGRNDESLRRVDLMLSNLRRPCDDGARLTSYAIQLDSVKFTSRHPQNQQSATWDLAYRALAAFLARADAAQLDDAVAVADDATVYWHFGDGFGLTTQGERLAALTDDVTDMATIASQHSSSLKGTDGRPILVFYVDSALATAAEMQGVLDGARQASGVDFYAIATTLDGAYFAAFDGLAPWLNLGIWSTATGSDLHARAVDYAQKLHAQLLSALPSSPGRVVLAGVNPGFDDFTENWGACTMREMPRDPALLQGQLDWATQAKLPGAVVETWDDWTEGSEIEPDVDEGPAKLLALRDGLGELFGDAPDATGAARLAQRWTRFGQARSCCFMDGSCPDGGVAPSPTIDLTCPASTPALDGGNDGGADAGDAPSADASTALLTADDGCGCTVGGAGSTSPLFVLALGLAVAAARTSAAPRGRSCTRRRCRRGSAARRDRRAGDRPG